MKWMNVALLEFSVTHMRSHSKISGSTAVSETYFKNCFETVSQNNDKMMNYW